MLVLQKRRIGKAVQKGFELVFFQLTQSNARAYGGIGYIIGLGVMVEHGIEAGQAAVVHIRGRKGHIAQRGYAELAKISSFAGYPLAAFVVGAALVAVARKGKAAGKRLAVARATMGAKQAVAGCLIGIEGGFLGEYLVVKAAGRHQLGHKLTHGQKERPVADAPAAKSGFKIGWILRVAAQTLEQIGQIEVVLGRVGNGRQGLYIEMVDAPIGIEPRNPGKVLEGRTVP